MLSPPGTEHLRLLLVDSSSARDCKRRLDGASLFTVIIAATKRPPKAFALRWILTAVALVSLLVSFAAGARKFANERSVRNSCIVTHARILGFLEAYKTEYQDYPMAAHPDETVVIDGQTFPVGAAMMLYQVMSGDGTDQVGTPAPTAKASDGTLDNDEPPKIGGGFDWFSWKLVDGRRFVADALGHPFQYEKGGSPDAVNPSFDLWSCMGDRATIGKRDAATKRDPSKTANWVKNFPIEPAQPGMEK